MGKRVVSVWKEGIEERLEINDFFQPLSMVYDGEGGFLFVQVVRCFQVRLS